MSNRFDRSCYGRAADGGPVAQRVLQPDAATAYEFTGSNPDVVNTLGEEGHSEREAQRTAETRPLEPKG